MYSLNSLGGHKNPVFHPGRRCRWLRRLCTTTWCTCAQILGHNQGAYVFNFSIAFTVQWENVWTSVVWDLRLVLCHEIRAENQTILVDT